MTGIDASQAGILVAKEHARADPLIHERTTYRNITAEQAVDEGQGSSTADFLNLQYCHQCRTGTVKQEVCCSKWRNPDLPVVIVLIEYYLISHQRQVRLQGCSLMQSLRQK